LASVISKSKCYIHILGQHLDKVNWHRLSQNPNAVPILQDNLDKVD